APAGRKATTAERVTPLSGFAAPHASQPPAGPRATLPAAKNRHTAQAGPEGPSAAADAGCAGRSWNAADPQRAAQVDGGTRGLRPSHHHQLAPPNPPRRQAQAPQLPAPDPQRNQADRLLHPDRQPETPPRRKPRDRL